MKNNVYVYLYVCIWIILLYSGNLYNIVNQLHFNKILKNTNPVETEKSKQIMAREWNIFLCPAKRQLERCLKLTVCMNLG